MALIGVLSDEVVEAECRDMCSPERHILLLPGELLRRPLRRPLRRALRGERVHALVLMIVEKVKQGMVI